MALSEKVEASSRLHKDLEGELLAALRSLLDQAVSYRSGRPIAALRWDDYASVGPRALLLHEAIDKARFGGGDAQGVEIDLKRYVESLQ